MEMIVSFTSEDSGHMTRSLDALIQVVFLNEDYDFQDSSDGENLACELLEYSQQMRLKEKDEDNIVLVNRTKNNMITRWYLFGKPVIGMLLVELMILVYFLVAFNDFTRDFQ